MELVNLFEYEDKARQLLPKMAYDYYASGANDEITLRENHTAYNRFRLQYRVLRGSSRPDPSASILGIDLKMPILIAPTAFQCMAFPEGEVATARAASEAGTVMTLSTLSTRSMEAVAAAARMPLWFQLYMYKEKSITIDLVQRAAAAGFTAIVLTVDAPVWGRRERDIHNRFRLPAGLSIKNLAGTGKEKFLDHASGSGLTAYVSELFNMNLK